MADQYRGSDDQDGRQEMDRGRDRATRGRDLDRGRGSRDRYDRGDRGGAWRGDDLSALYGYEGEGYLRGGHADFGNRSEYRGGRGDLESGEYSSYGRHGMARGESGRSPREGYQGGSGRYDADRDDMDFGRGRWNAPSGSGDRGVGMEDRGTGYGSSGAAGWPGAGVGGVDYNRGSSERGGRGREMSRGEEREPGSRTLRQSYRGRGPKGYQRSDDRIREDVCERLTYDHDVDATEVDITVKEGVVTLSGSVDDRWAKRRAEDIVESVSGVKDVENQIRVSSNMGPTRDPAVRHSE